MSSARLPSGPSVTKSKNRAGYEAHTENVRALGQSIVLLERQLKDALRDHRAAETPALSRMLYVMSGMWCECLLRKTLATRGFLNDERRQRVLYDPSKGGRRPQDDRWRALVDAALAGRYGDQKFSRLPKPAQKWSRDLKNALKAYVDPLIADRNATAHGGWAAALDGDRPRLSGTPGGGYTYERAAPPESYVRLRLRRRAVLEISNALLDLVAIAKEAERRGKLEDAMRRRMARLSAIGRDLQAPLGEPRVRKGRYCGLDN